MKINNKTWDFVVKKLTILKKEMKEFEEVHKNLIISPESPLIEPFWILANTLIESLSLLINDANHTINWFVYDCDFGEKPKEASIYNKTKSINSFKKLRWFLENLDT